MTTEERLEVVVENQIILVNLIGALAYRLTGEVPVTSLEQSDNGTYTVIKIKPDVTKTSWGEALLGSVSVNREHDPIAQ
jgi:hypothetical protein